MSNSFELLHDPIMKFRDCMKYYPIVIDTGEKVQGSQSDKDVKTGFLDLIVY